jgi:hypothetical protein
MPKNKSPHTFFFLESRGITVIKRYSLSLSLSRVGRAFAIQMVLVVPDVQNEMKEIIGVYI